jgi:protein-arginine kinase activator protein McsA
VIRLTKKQIEEIEQYYEGITEQIEDFEKEEIPPCPKCGSTNTALVQIGFVGRLNAIAAATSKVTIVMNGPKPGKYMCRACRTYYDDQVS